MLSTTSPLTIPSGQSVPLMLAVSDTGTAFNAITGTATFKDNGSTILGTAGQATTPYTFSATGLAPGSHALTAVYGGGSGNAASPPSNTINVTVQAALPSQTITFNQPLDVMLGDVAVFDCFVCVGEFGAGGTVHVECDEHVYGHGRQWRHHHYPRGRYMFDYGEPTGERDVFRGFAGDADIHGVRAGEHIQREQHG